MFTRMVRTSSIFCQAYSLTSFSLYRLRTVDKGKPLIIDDRIIADYSVNNVRTLHMKNLLLLGEDRYFTTLLLRHFPKMKTCFIPHTYARTAAPESWSVLFSQRRRWINSTVHNLVRLMSLKDLCGMCCFGMRYVDTVFVHALISKVCCLCRPCRDTFITRDFYLHCISMLVSFAAIFF